jgi:hypothetical protein
VGKRITVVAAKMSEDLGDAETHIFRLCDGSAEKPVYAVLPAFHIMPSNRELGSAPYGTVLEIRNLLVRYNPAHDAYNLLVSRDSGVTIPTQQGNPSRSDPGPIRPPIGIRHRKKRPVSGSVLKKP